MSARSLGWMAVVVMFACGVLTVRGAEQVLLAALFLSACVLISASSIVAALAASRALRGSLAADRDDRGR